jgi:hypothetical protein
MHDMYEIGREYKYDNQSVARHLPVNKYAVIPTHGHEIVRKYLKTQFCVIHWVFCMRSQRLRLLNLPKAIISHDGKTHAYRLINYL